MSKAKLVVDSDGRFYGVQFDCPGCKLDRPGSVMGGGVVLPTDWTPHGYERSPHMSAARWGFNGDLDHPTFDPSVLCTSNWGPEQREVRCHSYVTDGRIQFLPDCTHALAGQTVDLSDICPEDEK